MPAETTPTSETISGRQHLVRVGALGTVGHFTSVDAVRYPRSSRVVVRTGRGLEIGEILAEPDTADRSPADGAILRGVTVEDNLLLARLEKNRAEAYRVCAERLAQIAPAAVLMDVEPLFDGRTLVFYFLGEMTPAIEALTDELAELHEAHVQFRKFADAVNLGCGPNCGTESASGCQGCSTGCAIAGACASRH